MAVFAKPEEVGLSSERLGRIRPWMRGYLLKSRSTKRINSFQRGPKYFGFVVPILPSLIFKINGGHNMQCPPFLPCLYGHFCVFQDRH